MKIKTKDMALVALFAALTAISAFIKIPIGPVPISLQFLFTALSGIILGAKLGMLSQLLYICIGLIGIPVFTAGGGPTYVLHPAFGYLMGFVLSAYIIGKASKSSRDAGFVRLFFATLLGLIAVYIVGVPYMYLILKNIVKSNITIQQAIKTGFIVFIPGDILKCILAAFIGIKVLPRIKNI